MQNKRREFLERERGWSAASKEKQKEFKILVFECVGDLLAVRPIYSQRSETKKEVINLFHIIQNILYS